MHSEPKYRFSPQISKFMRCNTKCSETLPHTKTIKVSLWFEKRRVPFQQEQNLEVVDGCTRQFTSPECVQVEKAIWATPTGLVAEELEDTGSCIIGFTLIHAILSAIVTGGGGSGVLAEHGTT